MSYTPKSMMSKATITCLNVDCPERFSVCCGAKSINKANAWGADPEQKDEFICLNCGNPFVGGECTAGDKIDMSKPTQKEYKQMVAIGKRADKMAKSFFDYSLKEKKEIMDKAGKEAQKMMQETIRKADALQAKGEWEKDFEMQCKKGLFDNRYTKGANYTRIKFYIRSLRSQAYEEGRRDAIELVKKHIVHARAICKDRDCWCEYRDRNRTLYDILDILMAKEKI